MNKSVTEKYSTPLAAWVALLLGGCWLVASATTLWRGADEYTPLTELQAYMNGKAASHMEDWFNDHLLWDDAATGAWGALRHSVFNTGSKGVLIGKDGWLFSDEEFSVPDDAETQLRQKLDYITITRDFLAAQDSDMLVVLLPSKARLYSEYSPHVMPASKQAVLPKFINDLHLNGIALIDGRNYLTFYKEDSARLFMQYDTHWTPLGAQKIAEDVARYFVNAPYDRAKTTITLGNPTFVKGDLLRFVPLGPLEGITLPKGEVIPQYRITQENTGGLFGDVAASFALVGTSYSYIKDWQFADFLKYTLQADVLNLAEEGKGPFAPMQAYLERIKAGEDAAPYVIWEIPERFLTTAYDVDFMQFEEAN